MAILKIANVWAPHVSNLEHPTLFRKNFDCEKHEFNMDQVDFRIPEFNDNYLKFLVELHSRKTIRKLEEEQ